MARSSDQLYRTAIPLGVDGLVIVIGLLIVPVVVFSVNPEILLATLFDV
jgi:hypothetical protein